MSGERLRDTSSKSRSRVRASRDASPAGPESLFLLDGPVTEEGVELLGEFVHPYHRESEETEAIGVDEDHLDQAARIEQIEKRNKSPWWKKPSVWWFISLIPFSTMASTATTAPRIEVFTNIICDAYKHSKSPGSDWDSERLGLSVLSMTPYSPLVCSSDPVVQAGVATVLAAMATTTGILSCFTTGWWGSLSDRYGRTFIMGIAICGLLVQDLNFIIVTLFPSKVPGGHLFVLFGSVVEGCLGGLTTSIAAIHAYLADCSTAASRARNFSLFLGLLFTGAALGPSLGSLTVRWSSNVMVVFYMSTSIHFVYALLTWFVIPESLLPVQMMTSRRKHAEEAAVYRRANGLLPRLKSLFSFLSPLIMLAPPLIDRAAASQKFRSRDWSLTLVAVAYGCVISLMGSLQYVLQYAGARYHWSTVMLGYWISTVSAARALYLTIFFPLIIRMFRPKASIQLPVSPSEPLDPRAPSSPANVSSRQITHPSGRQPHEDHHPPSFDLKLARISALIDIVSYAFMALAPTPITFVAASALGSLGTAFSPTVHSLSLELYRRRGGTEFGKLFGAMSVVQALSSQIIGPAAFGFVYIKTVATFPQTLLFVAMGLFVIAFILLSLVRLDNAAPYTSDVEGQPSPIQRDHQETFLEPQAPAIVVEDMDAELGGRGRRL
ncbi:hypothetical protein HETIRDRAFT_471204 [Heterobasidion irregulare TC 32-1]|uniref:Major facilitator superfamily n=1 Tax=Heterobasidion irregulare (strain TC 32-1) TaxID=747525 RepID=W4KJT1_HETIT|nr:uncharacterized protein HETIRDRAFT_471204 [Heterobasidion irregulare TC 32-1]ETW85959.1 hypothetical protein HETIRDRAFT_471204 [Heterobasidion irregulare TC 32-1]